MKVKELIKELKPLNQNEDVVFYNYKNKGGSKVKNSTEGCYFIRVTECENDETGKTWVEIELTEEHIGPDLPLISGYTSPLLSREESKSDWDEEDKANEELKMYASKWLTEKKNPLGIEKTEDCLDIDESVTLYSCPRADKIEKQIIDLFGYEIGIAEAGEDWTVFVIRPNDINGRTYEHWTSKELGGKN
jgi:hypothetical protein